MILNDILEILTGVNIILVRVTVVPWLHAVKFLYYLVDCLSTTCPMTAPLLFSWFNINMKMLSSDSGRNKAGSFSSMVKRNRRVYVAKGDNIFLPCYKGVDLQLWLLLIVVVSKCICSFFDKDELWWKPNRATFLRSDSLREGDGQARKCTAFFPPRPTALFSPATSVLVNIMRTGGHAQTERARRMPPRPPPGRRLRDHLHCRR